MFSISGLEHLQDKIPVGVGESIIFSLFHQKCWKWIEDKRNEYNLPPMKFQGQFSMTEFTDRFPLFLPTTPSLYGEPHPSAEFVFTGGFRDEEDLPKIDNDLKTWIDSDDADIVYLSLGTFVTMDKKVFKDFYEKMHKQNRYRLIWSLGLGLQNIAKELGIFPQKDNKILLSDYLPQYALLCHPKVKVFVTHIGLGSAIELMKQKIPGVFVPQFFDQPMNTIIMENLSLGVSASSFDFEHVDNAIQKVFDNYDFYYKNLEKISDEFAKYEDPEMIDNFIQKIAARKKTTVKLELEYQVSSPRLYMAWNAIQILAVALLILFILTMYWCARKCCFRKGRESKETKAD